MGGGDGIGGIVQTSEDVGGLRHEVLFQSEKEQRLFDSAVSNRQGSESEGKFTL